jgi:hypothetical protein
MSETSEDKSKRKYVKVLRDNQWSYQYSVFYENPEESVGLLDHMVKFKRCLKREYSGVPFLFRIQLHTHHSGELQAFLTLFTIEKLKGFDELANKAFPSSMSTLYQRLTDEMLSSKASAILQQRPHSLSKVFSKEGQNRWGILNKDALKPIQQAYRDETGE